MARTVLLADDSVTAQNMGRRILIDAGYEVITVNNGSAALKKVHESRPDLIVLDVYMPGYGGLEVCQRLKESEETAKIPILLTVGKMEPFKPEEARRARADGHIVKPFEASELLAALTRLEDRIVPQPEPSRSRRAKPEKEKKVRSWRGGDPAMSYDDTHSEKIAYLAEVKQRRASHESERSEGEQENAVQAEASRGHENSSAVSSTEEEIAASPAPKPRMAMPMSVYAAEQLQELPVVAGSAERSEEETEVPKAENQDQAAASQQPVEGDEAQSSTDTEIKSASRTEIENVRVESTPSVAMEEVQSTTASEPPQEIPGAAGESELHESKPEAETARSAEEVPAEPEKVTAAGRWVAENVALTADEAALELEREMHEVRAQAESQMEQASQPAIVAESSPAESPAQEEKGATFAAAASASGSSAVGSTIPESEAEPAIPSEAAAAWENWQHIRDSVMGSQTAVQLSESVAEAVKANAAEPVAESNQSGAATSADQPAASTSAEKSGETTADADVDADSAALSSIVDSVLAELKPKLMREISKKLKK